MERRIRTRSGFWAQGAVERKFPNGNPDVTDWFWSRRSGFGNFAREWIENVATVGVDENGPGTEESGTAYKPPLPPSPPTFAFCFHCVLSSFCYCA